MAARTVEEWISFSAVFLNELMIEGIGILDSNLRHICSDSDSCLRARAQGWKLYYEPAAVVRHGVGTSNRGAAPALRQIMAQDVEYFRRKWIEPAGLFRSLTRYFPEEAPADP